MNNKEHERSFLVALDGCGDYGPPIFEGIDSFKLGICKLEFDGEELHVYLRRPGLLIGHHGETIHKIQKYLNVPITIHEFDLIDEARQ